MLKFTLLSTLSLLVLAKTAFAGCTGHYSYTSCADGIIHDFDPNTGEICDPLNCGGDMGPYVTDVPGCPHYSGTIVPATTPSYLPCWKAPGSSSATISATRSTTLTTTPAGSTPSTTPSATLPTQGSATGTATTAAAKQTANAGNRMGGSLMGVALAAFGAIELL